MSQFGGYFACNTLISYVILSDNVLQKRGTMAGRRYLTEGQVAEIVGRAVQTLRNDRFRRQGLPYIKLGKLVRYDEQDVIDYMESRKIQTEIL